MSPSVYPSLSGRQYARCYLTLSCPSVISHWLKWNHTILTYSYLILSCLIVLHLHHRTVLYCTRCSFFLDCRYAAPLLRWPVNWNVIWRNAVPCHTLPCLALLSLSSLQPGRTLHIMMHTRIITHNGEEEGWRTKKKLQQFSSLDRYHAVLYIHSTAVRYSTPIYFPLFKEIKSTIDVDNEEEGRQDRAVTVSASSDPHCSREQHATRRAWLGTTQHGIKWQHATWHMTWHVMQTRHCTAWQFMTHTLQGVIPHSARAHAHVTVSPHTHTNNNKDSCSSNGST